jgi:hypothetical protein
MSEFTPYPEGPCGVTFIEEFRSGALMLVISESEAQRSQIHNLQNNTCRPTTIILYAASTRPSSVNFFFASIFETYLRHYTISLDSRLNSYLRIQEIHGYSKQKDNSVNSSKLNIISHLYGREEGIYDSASPGISMFSHHGYKSIRSTE